MILLFENWAKASRNENFDGKCDKSVELNQMEF